MKKIVLQERSQFFVFTIISSCVFVLTLILNYVDPSPFYRFLGDIDPIILLLFTFFLGFWGLAYLISRTHLAIYKKHYPKDFFLILSIALIFGVEVILADLWLVDYAADINIFFPKSLLFYPAIGYIVEVIFHIIPISCFVFVLSLFKRFSTTQIVWTSLIAVAIVEPLYQVWFLSQDSLMTVIYTGIHVFLFSLTQVLIFKRFDFVSMYFFRLVFYLIWHILWGYYRLELFFNA
jgi:hypothetical protein